MFCLPPHTVIVLEGSICAGKTTAWKAMEKCCCRCRHPIHFYGEDIDEKTVNEFKAKLAGVGGDTDMLAESVMEMQEGIAAKREKTMEEALRKAALGGTCIVERGDIGNLVFAFNATLHFSIPQERVWRHMIKVMSTINSRKIPEGVGVITVFFKVSPDKAHARNEHRDGIATAYSLDYLTKLGGLYDQLQVQDGMVIIDNSVDGDETDLVSKVVFGVTQSAKRKYE
jgi:thymidylate kinase